MTINKFSSFKKVNYGFWIPIILFFLYLLYINQSVTLMADDFRYSMRSCFNFVLPDERITTVFQMFETAYYDYMYYCARYATAILIYFVLLFGTTLFKILNPLIITLQIILATKIFSGDPKLETKKSAVMGTTLILLFSMISPILLDETVFWITGAITYSWPVTFLLIHLNLYLFPNQKKDSIFKYIGIVLLSIYLGSTSENISITTTILTVLLILYFVFIKNDRNYFNKTRIISVLTLIVANGIQIISPGTRHRTADFNTSLLDNVFKGTFSFVQYEFFLSYLLPAILIGLLLFLIYRKNKKVFSINLVIMLPLIIFIILNSLPNNAWIIDYEWICRFIMPLDFYNWALGNMNMELYLVLVYYWGVVLVFIVDVFYLFWKNDYILLTLFVCSACSLLALIPIGGAVPRVSYTAVFFMMITSSFIIMNIMTKKSFYLVLMVICLYYYGTHLNYLKDNISIAKEREIIYSTMKESNENLIVLPKYRFSVHGNFSIEDSWEHYMFKLYYDIVDKTVIFE